MTLMTYWSCQNDHIVLDWYMPKSGDTCNVQGCHGVRTQYSDDVPNHVAAMNTVITWLLDRPDEEGLGPTVLAAELESYVYHYFKENPSN